MWILPSRKEKLQRGYNRAPLHPVYPFSVCFALFTICFWLAVHTCLPGWFHLLAGLTVIVEASVPFLGCGRGGARNSWACSRGVSKVPGRKI